MLKSITNYSSKISLRIASERRPTKINYILGQAFGAAWEQQGRTGGPCEVRGTAPKMAARASPEPGSQNGRGPPAEGHFRGRDQQGSEGQGEPGLGGPGWLWWGADGAAPHGSSKTRAKRRASWAPGGLLGAQRCLKALTGGHTTFWG